MPRPLLSEALRGHGALIRDMTGERFVDELLPRDQVSRAMTKRMIEEGTDHCWLDATGLEAFEERFPTINAELVSAGLYPSRDWLPIAPAAHYLCGGVVADLEGATDLPGLWAAGEVACSGVHGANRLASNSLLEGMVFAFRAIEAIERGKREADATGAMRAVLDGSGDSFIGGRRLPRYRVPAPPAAPAGTTEERRRELQRTMTVDAGVLRTAESLDRALRHVLAIEAVVSRGEERGRAEEELRNLASVSAAMVVAAMAREESRGAHTRGDFPDRNDERFRVRLVTADVAAQAGAA
jgi:L-aspartate oxidase